MAVGRSSSGGRQRIRFGLAAFLLAFAAAASAEPLAVGDLLMSCAYWGITRIENATGEQHPLGVGSGGSYSTIREDDEGLIWMIDNRWVVSIDPATAEHRLVLQLPNDFNGSNNGELLPEPGGTLLYAGDGEISRIDPVARSLTPVVTGVPLVTPLGLDWDHNGDLLIADIGAGAVFRWNATDGIAPIASGDMLVNPTRVRQLADGDLLVLRGGGRPVRVDPDTAGQSFYSSAIGSVSSAAIASNGDLIYANTTSSTGGSVWRSTSPEATPIQVLPVGQFHEVGNVNTLSLTADDQVLILGNVGEFTAGVVTDSTGGVFELDPFDSSYRVLSRRPPTGGIATSADGRLFLANQAGTGFNLREIDPYTGNTRQAAAGALFTRPFDAAVEADGDVVVVNGIPNGIPSVLRVDPDTGDTVLLSPTDQLIDPEKIAVAPNGDIFVSDFQVGLVRVDPATGEQTVLPDSDDFEFLDDLEIEASGSILAVEEAGEHVWRVDPGTGGRVEVGPLLDLPGLEDPQGYGNTSSFALGVDGHPYLSLIANSAGGGLAIFRAPTAATETTFISDLPLCAGDDLEVVRALPAPEPGAAAASAAALIALGARLRSRARS